MTEQKNDMRQPKFDSPDDSVFSAMRVDPKPYKANWNTTFFDRTKYAVAGLLYMIRRERSIRNVLLSGVVVFGLAAWLGVAGLEMVILGLTFSLLWTVETLNSAVEAVVDMFTQEYHPMAKVAKDVAASATFVASVTALIISLALVGIPLIQRLTL